MGITEIFSIFLERLKHEINIFKEKIKITDENTLYKIIDFNNFMKLFFVTFYSVNSLTKMDFWMNKLSIEKTNKTYSHLIKKYTGINIPREYWMLHHIMPESIMYVPSYLLAAVRANELERKIYEKYGQQWWELEKTGNYLKNLKKDESNTNIDAFSKLDPIVFLKEITST